MALTRTVQAGMILRDMRRSAGLTTTEVESITAREHGREGRVGKHQVSRLENGIIGAPTAEMLAKLATVYDVPVSDILDAYGYRTPGKQSHQYPTEARLASLLPRLPEIYRARVLRGIEALLDDAIDQSYPDSVDVPYRERREDAEEQRLLAK